MKEKREKKKERRKEKMIFIRNNKFIKNILDKKKGIRLL